MRHINLNYQARGFNVVTASSDGEFNHLKDWMRSELHIKLDTCAVDSHVPRDGNTIRYMKERLRSIQCETLFKNIQKD